MEAEHASAGAALARIAELTARLPGAGMGVPDVPRPLLWAVGARARRCTCTCTSRTTSCSPARPRSPARHADPIAPPKGDRCSRSSPSCCSWPPKRRPSPPPPVKPVQPILRNWTRVEIWRYFEPPASSTADPDTAHVGNRLLAGVRVRHGTLDGTFALQYVQFGGLPTDAIGPGALGTGALYYDHAGRRDSAQVYLRTANVAWRGLRGAWDVQVGRMGYTSGAERASGVAKIEAVKRMRLDSRLIGEFEWSLYQRAYDGVRVDWKPKRWTLTGAVAAPHARRLRGRGRRAHGRRHRVVRGGDERARRGDSAQRAPDLQPLLRRRSRGDRQARQHAARRGPRRRRHHDGRRARRVPQAGGRRRGRSARLGGAPGRELVPSNSTAPSACRRRPGTSGPRGGGRRGCAAVSSTRAATAMPPTIDTGRSSRCCPPCGATRNRRCTRSRTCRTSSRRSSCVRRPASPAGWTSTVCRSPRRRTAGTPAAAPPRIAAASSATRSGPPAADRA